MKKIIAITISLLFLILMSTAFASDFNWGGTTTANCPQYEIIITQYTKLESDVGVAYKESSNLTVKKGDTVYYTIKVTSEDGEVVDADKVEYHDLIRVGSESDIFTATVTGTNPYVRVRMSSKTSLDKLFYKGENIVIENNQIHIGKLTFMRDDGTRITDVSYDGNAVDMYESLAELGISVEMIYDGKVCMSDDTLIRNFGQICESEAMASWQTPVVVEISSSLVIPKTGDSSVIIYAVAAIVVAIICAKVRFSHGV